jgi:2-polyprenyl-3-methyl-5-hydroxy-6-metoxy-1,4-benzoquinol methylase
MPIVLEEKYEKSPYERGRIDIIRRLIPGGPGNALDLGCGPGFFSRLLKERGWTVTAVDMELSNVEQAKRYADNGIVGDVISTLRNLKDMDFALALEIVEHLDDPEAFLAAIRKACPGRLLISSPNRMSPEGWVGLYWGERLRNWGKWNAWDPTHTRVFTANELIRILRKAGWKPREIVGYWYKADKYISLPLKDSATFPFNRIGFNTILLCD